MFHHFAKLGLKPDATPEEIKASYRRLVKRFHPDVPGGNPQRFEQVHAAYAALSDEAAREHFAGLYARHKARRAGMGAGAGVGAAAGAGNGSSRPGQDARTGNGKGRARRRQQPLGPPITRVMSIAVPRASRLVLDDLFGKIVIDPTTPEALWDTTLAKFDGADGSRLARHVIQARVTGQREEVRELRLQPTEYGVLLRPAHGRSNGAGRRRGGRRPIVVQATVPPGTALHFRDTFGTIILGELDNELRAHLDGSTRLRAARLAHASLTMRGASIAFLSQVAGTVDALLNDSARALFDGEIARLRVVLEKRSVIEVVGTVEKLLAEVMDDGFLHAKQSVATATCNAADNAYIRIAELRESLVGHRTERARIDVLKKPAYVPVRRHRGRGYAFAGI